MAYADVLVTAEVNILAGFYLGCFGSNTVGRQIPTCISSVAYFFQLAYVYSVSIGFACCYAGNLTVLVEGNLAVDYGIAILHVDRCALAVNHTCSSCCTIQCQFSIPVADGFDINQILVQLNLNFSAVMAYADVLVTAEVNIIAGFYVGCSGCNTVGRQIPTLVGSFFYSVQLAYVYSVSIGSTCCYIDNLTFSTFTAYGYCISSVSYTANAQGNTAFNRYRSTVADSNCIVSRNRILMTEGNNIAYASNCVFVAHYNGIGNIVQFIVGTCKEYIMTDIFRTTGKLVAITDNGRIGLFGNSVGTADYCYSTALLFSENRIVTAKNS